MQKQVRVMTIIVNPNDESDITILSDNIDGTAVFHERDIKFLEGVLRRLKRRGRELRKRHEESMESGICY